MSVNFLFWNLGGRALEAVVGRLAADHSADVVMLAECPDGADVTAALNAEAGGPSYREPPSLNPRFRILTRWRDERLPPIGDDLSGRMTFRRVRPENGLDVLLAVVHFHSRRQWDRDDQAAEVSNLAAEIRRMEDLYGHRRTVVVGDFNMDPFDKGMVAHTGIHAAMTRDICEAETRTVAEQEYPFFYNPMWGYFGDCNDGPPGTFYLRSGKAVKQFWHMFDQVLLRPSLMRRLIDLRIPVRAGPYALATKTGLPGGPVGSDHFPLLFSLDLNAP